jgi:hypothetical protein
MFILIECCRERIKLNVYVLNGIEFPDSTVDQRCPIMLSSKWISW